MRNMVIFIVLFFVNKHNGISESSMDELIPHVEPYTHSDTFTVSATVSKPIGNGFLNAFGQGEYFIHRM